MPVAVSYPCVYVEEDSSPSVSLRSSITAVPAIAVSRDNLLVKNSPDRCLRIDSWFDYTNKVGALCGTPAVPYVMDFSDSRDVAVRAYFENGGGYCYLVDEAHLEQAIQKHDDITLFVQSTLECHGIWSGLEKFCAENNVFAILDVMGELSRPGLDKLPKGNHIAAYYPELHAEWAGNKSVPASAVMAGIYCTVDRQRGVRSA